MALKLVELLSIGLAAVVFGVFWGPWLALSRSMNSFTADVFLAVVHRMDKNLGTIMTFLMPAALLSIVAVLALSAGRIPETFFLSLASLLLFIVALLVTALVEVPIVAKIRVWTISTLPDGWQRLRDRWVSFHLVRVGAGFLGLMLLVVAAIFSTS